MTVPTASGGQCFKTPKEVTLGEKPEFVFAPIPCFDIAKLQQDVMAIKKPK